MKSHLNQVHTRQGDHHVSREHDTRADEPVKQVDKGNVTDRRSVPRLNGHHCSSMAKE